MKDFHLHSFINSDNFTNGEIYSDNKKKFKLHLQKGITGGYMHMAPGSAISMMFYQTQLSKIMVIFDIVTKVHGCPDSKDLIF